MKALIFVLFPVLLYSQQIEIDTTGLDSETKEKVIKILNNVKIRESAEKQALAEKEKKILNQKKILRLQRNQDYILKEIKSFILSVKEKNKILHDQTKEEYSELLAVKPEEYEIYIPAQKTKWEQRPKRGLRRLFSKNKNDLIPYVLDSNNNQIYIEKP